MFEGSNAQHIQNSTAAIVNSTTNGHQPPRVTASQGPIAELYKMDYLFNEDMRILLENFSTSDNQSLLTKAELAQLNTFLEPYDNVSSCFHCTREPLPSKIDPQQELQTILRIITRPTFTQNLASIAKCTERYIEFQNFLVALQKQIEKRTNSDSAKQYETLQTSIKQALNRQLIQPVQYLPRIPMVLKEINGAIKNEGRETFETELDHIKTHLKMLNRKYDQRNLLNDLVIEGTNDRSLSDILFKHNIILGETANRTNISKLKFEYRRRFFDGFLFNWRRNQLLQKHLGLLPQDTKKINGAIKEAKQQHQYIQKLSQYNKSLSNALKKHDVDLDRKTFNALKKGARQNNGKAILDMYCGTKAFKELISRDEKGAILNECITNKASAKQLSYLHFASKMKVYLSEPKSKKTIKTLTPSPIEKQPIIPFDIKTLEKKIYLFGKRSTQAVKSTIIPIMPLRIRAHKLIREAYRTIEQIEQIIGNAPSELQVGLKSKIAAPLKEIALLLKDNNQEISNSQTPITKTDEIVASIQAAVTESLRHLLAAKNKPSQPSPASKQNSLHVRQIPPTPIPCA